MPQRALNIAKAPPSVPKVSQSAPGGGSTSDPDGGGHPGRKAVDIISLFAINGEMCVFVEGGGRAADLTRGECEIFFRSADFDSGDVSGVDVSRYGGESFHCSSAHTFDDSFIRWHKHRRRASVYVPAVRRP